MVYIFLADGFEEVEAITPLDYIRRCEELEITTVAVGGNKTVKGSHGIEINCDITEDMINPADIDMIILPGGMPGTLNLEKSQIVQETINYCSSNNKYIASICAAPTVLGHCGLLEGKNAVCFPGFENELKGANVLKTPVCVDGNIITSRGAGTANEFAFELIRLLAGEKRANLIKASIQWAN